MTAFNYLAMEKSGKEINGILHADSDKSARQQLRDKQLIPLQVKAIKAKASLKSRFSKQRVSVNDLSLLTRQLATLLEAGIPIEQSLQGVSEQLEKNHLKTIVQGVRAKVLEGHPLADAMRSFPQAFPELYCATVAAGEQTGRLDSVLLNLAEYTEKQHQTKQKISQALIYPSVMIAVSVAIICFLLTFVVPKIIDVFDSTGQELPTLTLVLISLSQFIKHYWLLLIMTLIGLISAFQYSLTKTEIKRKWHQVLLKIPLVGYMIKTINTARYTHTFAILLQAGVNVLEAMRVSSSLISNLAMRSAIGQSSHKVKEGTNVSQALKQTLFFNPMTIHLIASGENSGKLAEMLKRASNNLDNQVKRVIETGLTLFEPFIILAMGSVVLFIVLATLLPIFSMDQLV